MKHKCENCNDEFEIERHKREIFNNKLYLSCGTGKNMVYLGAMNREYALCPKCKYFETQWSAEARDQS